MSAVMKLMHQPAMVAQFTGKFGYSEDMLPVLAVVELACVSLYLIPGTAVLGAVVMTGYLGGAGATQRECLPRWLAHRQSTRARIGHGATATPFTWLWTLYRYGSARRLWCSRAHNLASRFLVLSSTSWIASTMVPSLSAKDRSVGHFWRVAPAASASLRTSQKTRLSITAAATSSVVQKMTSNTIAFPLIAALTSAER
jgi:hypothetical protein